MPAVRELEKANRPRMAENALKRVLIDAPRCAEAHKALAVHLSNSNRAVAAQEHLETAREIIGLTPELATQMAHNLRSAAKIPEAISASLQAKILDPGNVQTWVALAAAYQADGKIKEAAAEVAEAEKRFGRHPSLRRIAAVVLADGKDYEAAIARLSNSELLPIELLDRGRFREALGQYELAWRDWMAAKQYQRDRLGYVYPAGQVARGIADLTEICRPPRMGYLRGCDHPGRRPWPIFITGFPRSGTTMIEAALGAHPAIVAGDELMYISELIERAPAFLSVRESYPRALMATALPENAVIPELMRDYYTGKARQKLGASVDGAFYFTDKMPSNEMHWLLIALLFPKSPVVHVRRHPLDILISNMSHHLVHGQYNACSLEWCATHYALTDNLVDHYRDKLRGWLKLIEVRYETFVTDHRAGIDRILPEDLTPDSRCYDFHESAWHSRTISYRQIKQPVHDKSVGRYRPFLDFLRPIVPIVQATLDREGYSL
jgi:sulfotransferase family protein